MLLGHIRQLPAPPPLPHFCAHYRRLQSKWKAKLKKITHFHFQGNDRQAAGQAERVSAAYLRHINKFQFAHLAVG